MYPQPSESEQRPNYPEIAANPSYIQDMQRQLTIQGHRIAELEACLPQTNLISPNFLSRAFAVWGHYFVSNLILGIIFSCIAITIIAILSLVLGISLNEMINY